MSVPCHALGTKV